LDAKLLIRNIALLVFFGLLQVLFLNNIEITKWHITPYIYVAAILLFPFQTPVWFRITAAFALGLTVDIFSDTGGMHAFALVFTAYIRPLVLNLIQPRDGYDFPLQPLVSNLGFNWFLKYSLIMLSIHHLIFFLLDSFSFSLFFSKFHVLILSLIFSGIVILLSQFLIFRR
jgi:rod shape-determining protein MreD